MSSIRPYVHGDAINRIHWLTSVRHGELHVKEFELDKTADLWIYLDLERHWHRGEGEDSTEERAVTVAASIVRSIGTRVFWVQTGGFDTHANQGNAGGGAYANLMATFSDGVRAFYNDLSNQGLLGDTLVLQFSEFGRRISENGSAGTDHGAAGVMMATGGTVRGGIYGTVASLDPNPANPTLENNGNDVRHETDFRAVYARVLDGWLGADSVAVLGENFRAGAPQIV